MTDDHDMFAMGERMLSVVPWSRLFLNIETVCTISINPDNASTAWVTIDASIHKPGAMLTCHYSNDPTQVGTTVQVESHNGLPVHLTVLAGGFVVYQ